MDLKYKIRTYNFWISLSAAVLIVIRLVGQSLGFYVDSALFMDIATAVCGVLVVLGIIIMPTSGAEKNKNKKNAENTLNIAEECGIEQVPGDVQEEIQISDEAETCAEPQVVLDKTAEEETKEAIRAAIDQLASNPQELFELINQIVKRTN